MKGLKGLAERILSALGEGAERVRAILVFGSAIMDEEPSWASDLDVIVVLDDGCSDEELLRAWLKLSGLSQSPRPHGLLGHLFWSIEKATGMFKTPFVCRERDLRSLDFERIFGTSKVLSALMAPKKIVLGSVLRTCRTIYGSPPKGLRPPGEREALELLRNLMTCFSLAFGAYFLCPLTCLALKYVLEALKWTVYAVFYYSTGGIRPLTKILRALGSRWPWPWPRLSREFLRLRREAGPMGPLLLIALPGVLNLHLAALGHREFFSRAGRESRRFLRSAPPAGWDRSWQRYTRPS